jgi:glycosyltransferase involved in cell wall biosynthesis
MKILYVLPDLPSPSGWRTFAKGFLGSIRSQVEATLAVPRSSLKAAGELFPGLEIIPLPATQSAALNSLSGLFRLLATRQAVRMARFPAVDLVHSLEAYPTGLIGDWIARRLNVPHALTAHGTYGVVWAESWLDRPIYAGVLERAGLVCAVSNGTANAVRRTFPEALKNTPIRPVLIGVNAAASVPAEVAYAHVFPETPSLLSVGEVKGRKGHHLSLAAFARVKRQLPNARYTIIGRYDPHGTYYHLLQTFIREQQLQNVTFMGTVPDETLQHAYRGASLFTLTPQPDGLRFEGFGLVYLEAGAYGLPVVATRTGGIPDAVEDGVSGLLASPDSIDEVARAMLRLLTDRELAAEMGRANRRRAETLTWERCTSEQVQLYDQLLNQSLESPVSA